MPPQAWEGQGSQVAMPGATPTASGTVIEWVSSLFRVREFVGESCGQLIIVRRRGVES